MSRELEALRQRMVQRDALISQLHEVSQRIDTMESMLPELEQSVRAEQADVDRLEEGGFTNFVYGILGRQEEKRRKEELEAREAQEKYQSALVTLQELTRQRETLSANLSALGDPQGEYQRLYNETRQRLLRDSGPAGTRLRQLEEDGRQLRILEKELHEARSAGQRVMDQIDRIRGSLDSASTWGTVDLFSGGFFADIAKYSHMDDAEAEVRELQELLRRFSKELQDVDTQAQLSADIGSGMRFADFFFDGFFTDAMALHRIERVRDQIEDVAGQVSRHLSMVDQRSSSVSSTLSQKAREAEKLVLQS